MKVSRSSQKPSWLTEQPDTERKKSDGKQPKIIAAIPAYNEERTIAKIILKTQQKVDKVLVIDDGSTDTTADIARALGAIVVSHTHNRGYGAAIRTCFKIARKLNVETMIILDADDQHDPDDIPRLLHKIKDHKDVVIGSRFTKNSNHNRIPTYRKLGLTILNTAMRWAGVNVNDCQSGFRAYSRRAIEQINLQENSMAVSSEILAEAEEKELAICEVPIECNYDVEDPSTENPVVHGLTVLLSIMRLIEFSRPLHFFGIIGLSFFGAGIFFGVWTLNIFNATGALPLGPTLIMTLLVLVGIFTLYTGIILHSIARLWTEKELDNRKNRAKNKK